MPNKTVDLGQTFQEVGLNWDGWNPIGKRFTESQIERGIAMIENSAHLRPHRHEFQMWEAITTTDFPYLFGTIIDRELMARYRVASADYSAYTKMGTVSNFAQHTRDRLDGLDNILPRVTQKGEYLVAPVSSEHYTRQVFKRGRQFDISWEALVNDGMGAFDDVPARFSDAAINTDAWLVTSALAGAAGPNAAMYATAITNAGVLPASIANVSATLALMAQQTTAAGLPMGIRGMHIVVPPALEDDMRAILTSVLKQWTEVGAGGGVPVPTANVLTQRGLVLHVDPWLPYIDVSANVDTTWYVFADPAQGYAVGLDHLRGHEGPEIVMKASNKVSVGGGPVSPFDGDFESDNVFYRVRTCPGTCNIDPRMTYVQTGTGQG